MTDEELKALVADLAVAQARTDARLAKTDAKLDRLAEMYGGVDNPNAQQRSSTTNSLRARPVLNGVRFDYIDKNITRSRGGLQDTFDLLLVNGQTVYVIDVRCKAHEEDLRRLLDVKAVNFPRLFPEHAGRERRLGLAAFHFHEDLVRIALERGVTVLQRKGDVIETRAA